MTFVLLILYRSTSS